MGPHMDCIASSDAEAAAACRATCFDAQSQAF